MSHTAVVAAVCNQKGGVGKTTLTINLGAALADAGHRVLLLDLDPQAHLTEGLGLQATYLDEGPNLHACLVDEAPLELIVRHHPLEPFDLVPASYHLMLTERELFLARRREQRLADALAPLLFDYDWILIDCPPALGMLTDNALNAARNVIVPVQAEGTSVRAFDLLLDQIESLERGLRISVKVLAVVPNLVQPSLLASDVLTKLRQSVPVVSPTVLLRRAVVQSAWSAGRSLFGYCPPLRHQDAARRAAVEDYRELADFVLCQAAATQEAAHVG